MLLGHPWIFSGAAKEIPDCIPGEIVEIRDSNGHFLAKGYINPKSQILVRILSFKEIEKIDDAFIKRRITDALTLRSSLIKDKTTDSFRLINAEGDLLPGLVVDKYRDVLVVQILTAGMERFRGVILDTLKEHIKPLCIYEKSDLLMRKKEGLEAQNGPLFGSLSNPVEILENGIKFLVDVEVGQKTGFYLDQRDNRKELGKFALGKKVLNVFSYTGGFSIYALTNGANFVLNVEFSENAVEMAKKIHMLNGIHDERQGYIIGDAFEVLRDLLSHSKQFDIIILDPPKFAQSQSQLKNAIRGYKDINLLGIKLLKPGGLLFTFSCSGSVDIDLFSKIINWSAMDAKKSIQIVKRLSQPIDHPFLPNFPESEYLKGLVVRVL